MEDGALEPVPPPAFRAKPMASSAVLSALSGSAQACMFETKNKPPEIFSSSPSDRPRAVSSSARRSAADGSEFRWYWLAGPGTDRLGGRQAETGREHRYASQQGALVFPQQGAAPFDRGQERFLAGRPGTPAPGEQVEAV